MIRSLLVKALARLVYTYAPREPVKLAVITDHRVLRLVSAAVCFDPDQEETFDELCNAALELQAGGLS